VVYTVFKIFTDTLYLSLLRLQLINNTDNFMYLFMVYIMALLVAQTALL
jgi:hypothetical protein